VSGYTPDTHMVEFDITNDPYVPYPQITIDNLDSFVITGDIAAFKFTDGNSVLCVRNTHNRLIWRYVCYDDTYRQIDF